MQRNEWDLPEPVDVKPVKGSEPWRLVIVGVILVVLAALSFWVPIPIFYRFLPGPVRNVEDRVEINGATEYSSEGALLLTTVSIDTTVTFAEWISTAFDSSSAVVMKDDVTQGGTDEELLREARRTMRASKQHAEEVALSALGIAKPMGDGARVVEVVDGSPADGVLRAGDVIVGVDGGKVGTTCEVGNAIDQHEVGDEVEVTVKRGAKKQTLRMRTKALNPSDPGAPLVGILMEEVDYEFEPGLDVKINPGEIGGPSAGLMFALGIYDRLTPEDLTHGRRVAGTGEIACDGGVGAIGGIQQKIAAAEREDAEAFLTPAGNVAEAREVAEDIEIVPVSTFDDAIEYLEDIE